LRLTNKAILEAKITFMSKIRPDLVKSKKRKLNLISGEDKFNIIEEFEYEQEISKYYSEYEGNGKKRIDINSVKNIKQPLYVFLNVKELTQTLDLKKEIVITMLNQLEKLEHCFFSLKGNLAYNMTIRFHKSTPEDLAEKSNFIAAFLEIAKCCGGVYSCSVPHLAYNLKMDPFQIPKILYSLQNSEDQEISYDLEEDSFVLKLKNIP